MWGVLRAFLLLGMGYLLGVVPSLNFELFRFEESDLSPSHPYISLPIALGALLFSFYLISIPLSRVARSEKALTERYLSINQAGMN